MVIVLPRGDPWGRGGDRVLHTYPISPDIENGGGFETFEAYCKQTWDFHKSQAYRLIDSARVIETVSPIGEKPSPLMVPAAQPRLPMIE
jgi:hypothetical protein